MCIVCHSARCASRTVFDQVWGCYTEDGTARDTPKTTVITYSGPAKLAVDLRAASEDQFEGFGVDIDGNI